jgi:protein translocase SecG subunit
VLIFVIQVVMWPLCLFIIGLILLQGGAGDLSSAFGGGGQLDSTLGVGASRKMSKLTAWLAAAFLGAVIFLARPQASSVGSDESAPAGSSTNATSVAPVDPVITGTVGDDEQKITIGENGQTVEAVVPVGPEVKDAAAPADAEMKPDPMAKPDEKPAEPTPPTKPVPDNFDDKKAK